MHIIRNEGLRKGIFIVALLLCLTPWIDPPLALFLGLLLSQTIGHPFIQHNKKATKQLLQYSVIGLGFGMNLQQAAEAGKQGVLFTVVSIAVTIGLGLLVGRLLKIKRNTVTLVSVGTAICGGSAIAAVSPIIEAKEDEMSVSLGIVFILNAIALFIFPIIGHHFDLTQHQFGLWSAIAIHDTSSVVGAASKYGEEALQVATTVKLARALWIIPISLITAFIVKSKGKINFPWFILGFVAAMAFKSLLPQIEPVAVVLVAIAKKGLTLTLFLIGAGLTRKAIQAVGFRPMLLGIALWLFISILSFLVIVNTIN
jgi:uncharacterized integral membrane protein (TIGR00698 family)